MKTIKLKFDKVIADLYCPNKNNKEILILFCPGFPGSWKYESFARSFTSQGFSFIHPKYLGSWESEGSFSIKGCRKTIEEILNSLQKQLIDIFGSFVNLKFKKIFLLGHSFGGSISLSVGSQTKVDGIISLAPIIDFKTHNYFGNESDLLELFEYVDKGLKGLFRDFKKDDWVNLCKTGCDINPIDFFNELKNKKILFVHGKKDKSVDFKKTKEFFLKLRNFNGNFDYFECSDASHSDIRDKSSNYIIKWIDSIK